MATVNNEASLQTLVARVDCTQEPDLCNAEHIQGYPTLKLYQANDKTGVEYEGPRDPASLVEFLKKQLNIEIPGERFETPQIFA